MLPAPRFSHRLVVCLCSARLHQLPFTALPQTTNAQFTPSPITRQKDVGMADKTANPAHGPVSFRLGIPGGA
jgi:hypothetical protein